MHVWNDDWPTLGSKITKVESISNFRVWPYIGR